MHIRGTNSIALLNGTTACDDKNNLDGSQTNFGPVWAHDAWGSKGNSFRRIIEDNSNIPKPDSCWLEVYNDKTMNDLSELIVHNSNNNALYDVVMGVYSDKNDPLNSAIGFISRPVASPGPDPGQYGWYGLDPTEFTTYLSSHNTTRAQWMSWALSAFPRYGTSVVAGAKNKSVYMTNSNSFLNHKWFDPQISWGDQYDGKSDWYDYFYNAVMLDNKPFPRDPNLIFANYSLDGSTSDTKGIEYALKDTIYDESTPGFPLAFGGTCEQPVRTEGLIGRKHLILSLTAVFDDSQFLKMRQGFYNAFNIGSRSFELWKSYIVDVNKTIKNETRFIDEIDWFTQVFTLRNKLAYASDSANLPGAMIRNSDIQAPFIAISSPTTGSNVSGITAITGAASDNVAVSSVGVSINGSAYSLASGTASWTFSLNTASLANSTHTITARAVDAAGNASSVSITVVVQSTAVQFSANIQKFSQFPLRGTWGLAGGAFSDLDSDIINDSVKLNLVVGQYQKYGLNAAMVRYDDLFDVTMGNLTANGQYFLSQMAANGIKVIINLNPGGQSFIDGTWSNSTTAVHSFLLNLDQYRNNNKNDYDNILAFFICSDVGSQRAANVKAFADIVRNTIYNSASAINRQLDVPLMIDTSNRGIITPNYSLDQSIEVIGVYNYPLLRLDDNSLILKTEQAKSQLPDGRFFTFTQVHDQQWYNVLFYNNKNYNSDPLPEGVQIASELYRNLKANVKNQCCI